MGERDAAGAAWMRSSRCNSNDNCVEVCYRDGEVLIRDTKNLTRPPLCFSPGEWAVFLEGVLRGEFRIDRLDPGPAHAGAEGYSPVSAGGSGE